MGGENHQRVTLDQCEGWRGKCHFHMRLTKGKQKKSTKHPSQCMHPYCGVAMIAEGNRYIGEDGDAQAHRQPQGKAGQAKKD